jgi:glycosyltransferase involved in cell wall biosynthesis
MEIITNLKMNVSVVIPVLNEKESLPELVRELEHSLSTYSAWEVLFIDDGSSDGSTEWMSDEPSEDPSSMNNTSHAEYVDRLCSNSLTNSGKDSFSFKTGITTDTFIFKFVIISILFSN